MKEIPILFSTPMVQAIQENRKDKTRRLNNLQEINLKPDDWIFQGWVNDSKQLKAFFENKNTPLVQSVKCPWKPGDRLWVRETWAWNPSRNCEQECMSCKTVWKDEMGCFAYRASVDNIVADEWKWKPSIHMPKSAARIWLEVTDVRVERLQEITVEDVISEGLEADNEIRNPDLSTHESIKNWNLAWAHHVFRELWDHLNAKRGYGWETNPWLWVVSFRRVQP